MSDQIKNAHKNINIDLSNPRLNWLLLNRVPKLLSHLKERENLTFDPTEVLQTFSDADPSQNHSATQWLMETYLRDGFLYEDIVGKKNSKVYQTLTNFNKFKNNLDSDQKSIYNHRSLASLYRSIGQFLIEKDSKEPETLSSRALKRLQKEKVLAKTWILMETDDLKIVVPKTKFAAQWWGKGTQWCTAAEKANAFSDYNQDAPLLICLCKIDGVSRRLQLWFTEQSINFMDETDADCKDLIQSNWNLFEPVIKWAYKKNVQAVKYMPDDLITAEMYQQTLKSNPKLIKTLGTKHLTTELCEQIVDSDPDLINFIPTRFITTDLIKKALDKSNYPIRIFRTISKSFLTEDIYIQYLKRKILTLSDIPVKVMNEKICLLAIEADFYNFNYVPGKYLTKDFCTKVIESGAYNSNTFRNIPSKYLDKKLCLQAIMGDGNVIGEIPKRLIDENLCKVAVQKTGSCLKYIPNQFITKEICLLALEQDACSIANVPYQFLTSELCSQALRKKAIVWFNIPKQFYTTELCEVVIEKAPFMIASLPKHLISYNLCKTVVQQEGTNLQYVPEIFKTQEICKIACEQNGFALKYVSLENDQIYYKAVEQSANALYYVPEQYRTKAICDQAFASNPLSLQYFPKNLVTYDLCVQALEKDISYFNYIPDHLVDYDMCVQVLSENKEFWNKIPENFKQDTRLQSLINEQQKDIQKDNSIKPRISKKWNFNRVKKDFDHFVMNYQTDDIDNSNINLKYNIK